jgi:hypothetical protein
MLESQLDSLESPGVYETEVIPLGVNGAKEDVLAGHVIS